NLGVLRRRPSLAWLAAPYPVFGHPLPEREALHAAPLLPAGQEAEVAADAVGVLSGVAAADAGGGADVDVAVRTRRADAHHDVVVETEPGGRVGRFEDAVGGTRRDDLPRHRLRRVDGLC